MSRRHFLRAGFVLAVVGGALAGAGGAQAHYELCFASKGEDSCPLGERCSEEDGGAGICLPPPCTTDTDCLTEPLRQCDLRTTPSVCIECLGDSECTAPATCELDPRSPLSNRCVACRPSQGAGVCAGADAGRLCLFAKGVCGCAENVDCPARSFCRRGACIPRPVAGNDDSDAAIGVTSTERGPTARGSGCAVGAGQSETSIAWAGCLLASVIALRRRRR